MIEKMTRIEGEHVYSTRNIAELCVKKINELVDAFNSIRLGEQYRLSSLEREKETEHSGANCLYRAPISELADLSKMSIAKTLPKTKDLTFEQALFFLKECMKIRRKQWPPGYFIDKFDSPIAEPQIGVWQLLQNDWEVLE